MKQNIISETIAQYYKLNESTNNIGSIIKCPKQLPNKKTNWYVFLAGPIQGAPKWQFDMPMINGVTWLSPRRASYADFDYDVQTQWETDNMRLSDVILFWIPEKIEVIEGRDYAQTTRTEFGEYVAKGKKVVIGIHKDFSGRRYFETKCKQYGIKLHDNLNDTVTELKDYIKECEKSPNTYIISDTHFSSDRTLELSKRPFKTVEEMDWHMIQKWNDTVHPCDTIYHLGDFGNFEYLKYLNGYKRFIRGNYERTEDTKEELTFKQQEKKYLKFGFDEYYGDFINIELKDGNNVLKTYVLAHEPLTCIHQINQFKNMHSNDNKKCFGIFGHIHGRQFIKDFGIDAGVDCNSFKPIDLKKADFYENAITKGFYDEEVWCNGQTMPHAGNYSRVFLGGTCNNSTWRKEIIPELTIEYFNPVVKDWTEEAKQNEEIEKHIKCNLQLYVLTPRMTGTFSIAEVTESAINNGKRTVLCILDKDKKGSKDIEFDESQKRSLDALKELVKKYGAYTCDNLKDAAKYLNNFYKADTKDKK
ncbi:MAG: phosphoesterase [Wendovervirus sonii]|uniref:Phosphoesterase n=1 Tax=phage Lak_Megaphage_Sonny TaxID=3109229 RepID=A0ABZ0Z546_9CAUD|nr:MAG: phosphoesterase [phage Lak_Megaphage_Sonny]